VDLPILDSRDGVEEGVGSETNPTSWRQGAGVATGVLVGSVLCLVSLIELFYAMVFGGDYEGIPTETWEYIPWYALPTLVAVGGATAVWAAVRWGQARRHAAMVYLLTLALSIAAAIGWWAYAAWLV
jgi:cation transport ATPase